MSLPLPVIYYRLTGNLWPVVEHESTAGHLPRSCPEMKMSKLSAEREQTSEVRQKHEAGAAIL